MEEETERRGRERVKEGDRAWEREEEKERVGERETLFHKGIG